MDQFRYVLAVLFLISVPPALLYWFVVHPFHRQWRKLGPRVTLGVMFSLYGLIALGLFFVRDRLLGRDLGFHLWLAIPGILLYVLSASIELRTRRQLNRKILVGVPELDPNDPGTLLTEGIYERTRNPRYVGMIIGFLGVGMIANYESTWVLFVLTLVVIHPIVWLEERELRERFGQPYLEYCRQVPRWWRFSPG